MSISRNCRYILAYSTVIAVAAEVEYVAVAAEVEYVAVAAVVVARVTNTEKSNNQ
ncbi:unnamed protein product, partial [Rotaria sp. Silwood2]